MNYALIEIGCDFVAVRWWKNVDNVTTCFSQWNFFYASGFDASQRTRGGRKQFVSWCWLYVSFLVVYIVPYIESKNRPALDYALNCLERKRFRVENVSSSFFRSRGSCLVFLPSKERFMKRIQKIPVVRTETATWVLCFTFLSISLMAHLFIHKDPRISWLEVIFIFILFSTEIYVINAYFVEETS